MLNNFFNKNNKKKQYTQIQTKNLQLSNEEKVMEKCKNCSSFLLKKEIERNLNICPKCNFYFPLHAIKRIESIIDKNSFKEINADIKSCDPLEFPTYQEKLNKDIAKTNLNEAILTGTGLINHIPVVIGVMDSRFRMGSMGSVVGEKITRAIEHAINKRKPFILFSASGGARMQEGVLSLMQMAKTSAALSKLDEEGLLFISILTNPTTGGVSASFASLGDINIAEPNALIGFAGRRIIEQTIKEELPNDFQTSEFLLKHGQLDLIVERKDMKEKLFKILQFHNHKGEVDHE